MVQSTKLYGLDAPVEPAIYAVHTQEPNSDMGLVVRTQGDPATLTGAVRARDSKPVDAEQPISNVRTMQKVLSDSLMLRRVSMLMLSVFAGLAPTLATVGIYGLTTCSVSRRTHEIRLRAARRPNADPLAGGGPRAIYFTETAWRSGWPQRSN